MHKSFLITLVITLSILLTLSSNSLAEEASASASASTPSSGGGSSIRLAMQGRVDVANLLELSPNSPFGLTIPIVTPGVRLLDNKLFVGLGLDFSTVADDGAKFFGLSPMVSFDLLSRPEGALYATGWVNLGSIEFAGSDDSSFFGGMNLGLGIRAFLSPALSIGTEWGWSFVDAEDDAFSFRQGVFGNVMFEASIGI